MFMVNDVGTTHEEGNFPSPLTPPPPGLGFLAGLGTRAQTGCLHFKGSLFQPLIRSHWLMSRISCPVYLRTFFLLPPPVLAPACSQPTPEISRVGKKWSSIWHFDGGYTATVHFLLDCSVQIPTALVFFFFFWLEDNCFTMLWWSLPYININYPWLYIHSEVSQKEKSKYHILMHIYGI